MTEIHGKWQIRLWLVLAAIVVVTLTILLIIWIGVRPQNTTLAYELAKTCLQILGVAVVGGLVGLAINSWQDERKRGVDALETARREANENVQRLEEQAAKELEEQRRQHAADLEIQRELFRLRTSLLDRAARCAQRMYVVCQHVRRVQRDVGNLPNEVRGQLDTAYLDFSAEAAALETEFRARFRARDPEDLRLEPSVSTESFRIEEGEKQESVTYLRWHQVSDLLAVYYFALCENFRRDVLRNNSPHDGRTHSGVDFTQMVPRPEETTEVRPTPEEAKAVIQRIRLEFLAAMPALAEHALREPLIDVGMVTTSSGRD